MSKPRLFERFPVLEGALPWTPIGKFPTPVARLAALGKRLGATSLWVKRDDLTSRQYGGNKVRKLEWLLGDALRLGADRVLTVGALGSHHVLATAIHAGRLGLAVDALQFPRPLDEKVLRAVRTTEGYDTNVLWTPSKYLLPFTIGWQRALPRFEKRLEKRYYVAPGGSSALGVLGYVEAALELKAQVDAGEVPEPTAIFAAAGTGGTVAGLVLGCRIAGLRSRVVGVRVVDRIACNAFLIARLANQGLALLRRAGMKDRVKRIKQSDFAILHDHFGAGYGVPTHAALEAVSIMSDLERITLEPTYTGKTLSALLFEVLKHRMLRTEPVLFWNTFSSVRLQQRPTDAGAPPPGPVGYRQFLSGAERLRTSIPIG